MGRANTRKREGIGLPSPKCEVLADEQLHERAVIIIQHCHVSTALPGTLPCHLVRHVFMLRIPSKGTPRRGHKDSRAMCVQLERSLLRVHSQARGAEPHNTGPDVLSDERGERHGARNSPERLLLVGEAHLVEVVHSTLLRCLDLWEARGAQCGRALREACACVSGLV